MERAQLGTLVAQNELEDAATVLEGGPTVPRAVTNPAVGTDRALVDAEVDQVDSVHGADEVPRRQPATDNDTASLDSNRPPQTHTGAPGRLSDATEGQPDGPHTCHVGNHLSTGRAPKRGNTKIGEPQPTISMVCARPWATT